MDAGQDRPIQPVPLFAPDALRRDEACLAQHAQMSRDCGPRDARKAPGNLPGRRLALLEELEDAAARWICERLERVRAIGGLFGRHRGSISFRSALSWVIPQPLS